MLWRGEWFRLVALAGAVLAMGAVSARALDSIDFNLSAPSAQAGKDAPSDDDDDEDEASFFSSGAKGRNVTGTVATIGRLPASVAVPQPTIDVGATCRAVLADNLNYYNHNFIQGCERAVAQGRH